MRAKPTYTLPLLDEKDFFTAVHRKTFFSVLEKFLLCTPVNWEPQ